MSPGHFVSASLFSEGKHRDTLRAEASAGLALECSVEAGRRPSLSQKRGEGRACGQDTTHTVKQRWFSLLRSAHVLRDVGTFVLFSKNST